MRPRDFRISEHSAVARLGTYHWAGAPAQPDPALYQHQIEQRRKEAQSYLKAIRGEYQEQEIDASIELGEGNVIAAIINAAERHNADLIALAGHGRSGLAQVFYGV